MQNYDVFMPYHKNFLYITCNENFAIIDFFNQKLIMNSNMNIKDMINIISNIKMEMKNGKLDSLINNIYEKE